jgi:hypothetical protein
MAKALVGRIIDPSPIDKPRRPEMDHRTTIAIAEQRRADMLADADGARARRSTRTVPPRSLRSRFTRRSPV